MSEKSNMYEFKMDLFNNFNPEGFFVRTKLKDDTWNVGDINRQRKASVILYSILWQGTTKIQNFVFSG